MRGKESMELKAYMAGLEDHIATASVAELRSMVRNLATELAYLNGAQPSPLAGTVARI